MPLIIGLAAVGVVAVVALVLIMSGGDEDQGRTVPPGGNGGESSAHRNTASRGDTGTDAPPPRVIEPLTAEEVQRINARIDEIGRSLPEARRLKEEGFRAKKDGDAERAKEKWRAAEQLTRRMIEEANSFFQEFGGGLYGEERVEKYARRAFDAVGAWTKLRSDFLKYVESE